MEVIPHSPPAADVANTHLLITFQLLDGTWVTSNALSHVTGNSTASQGIRRRRRVFHGVTGYSVHAGTGTVDSTRAGVVRS